MAAAEKFFMRRCKYTIEMLEGFGVGSDRLVVQDLEPALQVLKAKHLNAMVVLDLLCDDKVTMWPDVWTQVRDGWEPAFSRDCFVEVSTSGLASGVGHGPRALNLLALAS